jgi:hypothetical protein
MGNPSIASEEFLFEREDVGELEMGSEGVSAGVFDVLKADGTEKGATEPSEKSRSQGGAMGLS